MKILTILYVIIFALTRGSEEGIVMNKPGPRSHAWYGYYHKLDILTYATFGLILLSPALNIPLIIGLSFLVWSLFELAYAFTRFGTLLPRQENVLGVGYYIRGEDRVLISHLIRLVISIVLIKLS